MGKLYVAGIGPGDYESMTIKARRILRECDVIIGYTVYVELIEQYFPDKEYFTTPMRKEKERCLLAFSEAGKGKTAALVCSGDAGIYGMAGLVLEIGREFADVEVEIIPGITSACSGAALLGAPLMHDFAVISLSDLLTPWDTIAKRLKAAAQADFAVCIYNPGSKKRAGYLKRACEILLEEKNPQTVCGVVRNAGREGEGIKILTLSELSQYEADMFTTVFIGNHETFCLPGRYGHEGEETQPARMITPRGYRL